MYCSYLHSGVAPNFHHNSDYSSSLFFYTQMEEVICIIQDLFKSNLRQASSRLFQMKGAAQNVVYLFLFFKGRLSNDVRRSGM